MENDLIKSDAELQIAAFKEDSVKLGKYTVDFIHHFYPAYGMNNILAEGVEKEDSLILHSIKYVNVRLIMQMIFLNIFRKN